MTASADGRLLYVGIGSNSNVGERGMAVEQDRAMHVRGNRLLGLGKGRHVVDHHVVALQRLRQRGRHLRLVFNQQYPHVLSVLLPTAGFRASHIATTLRKWPPRASRGAMLAPPQDSPEPAGYNRPHHIWEDRQ
mgnify:CR=1 FL=1